MSAATDAQRAAAKDPATSGGQLMVLAGNHPELRPLIARNASCSPQLRSWISQQKGQAGAAGAAAGAGGSAGEAAKEGAQEGAGEPDGELSLAPAGWEASDVGLGDSLGDVGLGPDLLGSVLGDPLTGSLLSDVSLSDDAAAGDALADLAPGAQDGTQDPLAQGRRAVGSQASGGPGAGSPGERGARSSSPARGSQAQDGPPRGASQGRRGGRPSVAQHYLGRQAPGGPQPVRQGSRPPGVPGGPAPRPAGDPPRPAGGPSPGGPGAGGPVPGPGAWEGYGHGGPGAGGSQPYGHAGPYAGAPPGQAWGGNQAPPQPLARRSAGPPAEPVDYGSSGPSDPWRPSQPSASGPGAGGQDRPGVPQGAGATDSTFFFGARSVVGLVAVVLFILVGYGCG